MSNQQERMKALIVKSVHEIIQYEIKNESIGFLTISNVDVTNDYSYVRIYVSFLEHPNQNFEKLKKIKGFVRSSLAKKINIRRAPDIEFILDDGFFKESHIEKILKKESEDLDSMKK